MISPRVAFVQPGWAIQGASVSIHGSDFPLDDQRLPDVSIGGKPARITYASPTRLEVTVPDGLDGGPADVLVSGCQGDPVRLEIAGRIATDLHQVDNPVFDRDGNLYVTYSGRRGETASVSIFRIARNGLREPFSTGIVNPTSIALDPGGQVYVSSRFEGAVYRLDGEGRAEVFASDLGVACGLAFAPDGTLFVGDRSGTIFKVDRHGHATPFASLPSSVAAFHLALGPDGALYVTGPTLSSYDVVYRIDPLGAPTIHSRAFGRPQGLAVDATGALHVVEALAGASGVYRFSVGHEPELVLAGAGLVGLAFSLDGGLAVCSNDCAYRLH